MCGPSPANHQRLLEHTDTCVYQRVICRIASGCQLPSMVIVIIKARLLIHITPYRSRNPSLESRSRTRNASTDGSDATINRHPIPSDGSSGSKVNHSNSTSGCCLRKSTNGDWMLSLRYAEKKKTAIFISCSDKAVTSIVHYVSLANFESDCCVRTDLILIRMRQPG